MIFLSKSILNRKIAQLNTIEQKQQEKQQQSCKFYDMNQTFNENSHQQKVYNQKHQIASEIQPNKLAYTPFSRTNYNNSKHLYLKSKMEIASMLPINNCIFMPFNKLYRSPITQVKNPHKIIFARSSKVSNGSAFNLNSENKNGGKILDGLTYNFVKGKVATEQHKLIQQYLNYKQANRPQKKINPINNVGYGFQLKFSNKGDLEHVLKKNEEIATPTKANTLNTISIGHLVPQSTKKTRQQIQKKAEFSFATMRQKQVSMLDQFQKKKIEINFVLNQLSPKNLQYIVELLQSYFTNSNDQIVEPQLHQKYLNQIIEKIISKCQTQHHTYIPLYAELCFQYTLINKKQFCFNRPKNKS